MHGRVAVRIGKAWPFCNTFRVTPRHPRLTRTMKLPARRVPVAPAILRPRGDAT